MKMTRRELSNLINSVLHEGIIGDDAVSSSIAKQAQANKEDAKKRYGYYLNKWKKLSSDKKKEMFRQAEMYSTGKISAKKFNIYYYANGVGNWDPKTNEMRFSPGKAGYIKNSFLKGLEILKQMSPNEASSDAPSDGKKDGSKKKKSRAPSTPFKNRKEGNAFRVWARSHKKWGKAIKGKPSEKFTIDGKEYKGFDLDARGRHNNSYIRRVYKLIGKEYKPSDGKKETKPETKPEETKPEETKPNV